MSRYVRLAAMQRTLLWGRLAASANRGASRARPAVTAEPRAAFSSATAMVARDGDNRGDNTYDRNRDVPHTRDIELKVEEAITTGELSYCDGCSMILLP